MTYYSPADLARLFKVDISTIRRNQGLRWTRVGRGLRISQAALDKYLAAREKPTLPIDATRSIIATGGQLDMGRKRGGYYNYGYGGVYSRRGKKLTRWYIDYREDAVRRR